MKKWWNKLPEYDVEFAERIDELDRRIDAEELIRIQGFVFQAPGDDRQLVVARPNTNVYVGAIAISRSDVVALRAPWHTDAGAFSTMYVSPTAQVEIHGKSAIGAEHAELVSLFSQEPEPEGDDELVLRTVGFDRVPGGSGPESIPWPPPVTKTEFVTRRKTIKITADPGKKKEAKVLVRLPSGFEYDDHGVTRHSVNHGRITSAELYDDGRELEVEASCEGGSWIDRYRGWVHATAWIKGRREVLL